MYKQTTDNVEKLTFDITDLDEHINQVENNMIKEVVLFREHVELQEKEFSLRDKEINELNKQFDELLDDVRILTKYVLWLVIGLVFVGTCLAAHIIS